MQMALPPLCQLTRQTGLGDFPAAQRRTCGCQKLEAECKMSQRQDDAGMQPSFPEPVSESNRQSAAEQNGYSSKVVKRKSRMKSENSWPLLTELVRLMQMLVLATALVLYYLIYCYMQLVYYTLRSVVYFHNADGLFQKLYRKLAVPAAPLAWTTELLCIYSAHPRMLGYQLKKIRPMKLTIAIVAVTTVIISFNFLRKIEKFIGLH